MAETEQCTKCGAPFHGDGKQKWCKPCLAKYQGEYQATKGAMAESRGYCAGVSAMRHAICERFRVFRAGMFSGLEVAEMVRKMPGPGDIQDAIVVAEPKSRT